jgi:hypothetical protein
LEKNKSPDNKLAYQKVMFFRGLELYTDGDYKGAYSLFKKSMAENKEAKITAKIIPTVFIFVLSSPESLKINTHIIPYIFKTIQKPPHLLTHPPQKKAFKNSHSSLSPLFSIILVPRYGLRPTRQPMSRYPIYPL